MALPITADKHEVVIQVEWDFALAPGVFTGWCGMEEMGVGRAAKVETVEVSDCDDRSLPKTEVNRVIGTQISITGTGNWSIEKSSDALQWFQSGARKKVRVWHSKATAGQVEYETGEAILTKLDTGKIFTGPVISEEIELKISAYAIVLKA